MSAHVTSRLQPISNPLSHSPNLDNIITRTRQAHRQRRTIQTIASRDNRFCRNDQIERFTIFGGRGKDDILTCLEVGTGEGVPLCVRKAD